MGRREEDALLVFRGILGVLAKVADLGGRVQAGPICLHCLPPQPVESMKCCLLCFRPLCSAAASQFVARERERDPGVSPVCTSHFCHILTE